MLPRLGLERDEDWMRVARATFREGDDGVLHFDWDLNLAKPFRDAAANPIRRNIGKIDAALVGQGHEADHSANLLGN